MSHDPERDQRLQRLFQAKREGDNDFLIGALSHYGGDEVGLPATWLAEAGDKRAIEPLTRLLDADSPHARRAAAKALEELGPEGAKARLVELAKGDPDAPARSWAIGALGKYKDRAMIPMIVAFLDDDDWRVRNGAASALKDIGDPSATEPLRQAKRKLWRSPLGWYLNNAVYRAAITSLRAGGSVDRPGTTLLRRLHRWLRRWFWRWAAILAFILLFGWIFGGLGAGLNIVQWVAIVLSGVFLVVLFWEGWVEWRSQRQAGGSDRPSDSE